MLDEKMYSTQLVRARAASTYFLALKFLEGLDMSDFSRWKEEGKGRKLTLTLSCHKTSRGLEATMNENENRWEEEEKRIFFMSAGVREDNSKFLCVPVPD